VRVSCTDEEAGISAYIAACYCVRRLGHDHSVQPHPCGADPLATLRRAGAFGVYVDTSSGRTRFRKGISPPFEDMISWQMMSVSFTSITAMQRYVVLWGDGNAERVGAARVLGNCFAALEARPQRDPS